MRLLLVEDDPLLRSTLKRDLERAGYVVDCVEDRERGEFLGSTEQPDKDHQSAIVDGARTEGLTGLEWKATASSTVPAIPSQWSTTT